MDAALALSPQIGSVGSVRLPSLDDLLESEVILGDDDEELDVDSDDESEMHSALEDLPPEMKISARPEEVAPVPDVQSADVGSPAPPAAPEEPVKVIPTPPATPRCESNASSRNSVSTRSKSPAPPPPRTPTHQPAKRADSGGSATKSRYQSPYAPRRSLSVLGAPSSPNGALSSSPASLSVSMTSSPASQPSTPIATRRPPATTPRPKLPTLMVRQPSNLKSSSSPPASASSAASPSPRRSSSMAPAARVFQAAGKQSSVIVGRQTGGVASVTTPPRREESRFATLGRKSSRMSPSASSATQTGSPIGPDSANQRDYSSTRETKAAADKFATLPRRPKAKERPPLPPKVLKTPEASDPAPGSSMTLPRPKKTPPPVSQTSTGSPAKPAVPPKPKIVLYMEKTSQTELSQQDVREGLEASQRLRALSRQPQVSVEEVRDLERLLQQSKEEAKVLRQELEEEREERHVVQQELERTTQRVAAMLDSMEGVEKEFHTRGDSLVQLETSLHTSTHAIYALQEQLEAQDAALIAQRLELDRGVIAQKNLIQQLQESESESREMMEFLQAEKIALNDALRDSESEIGLLKSQLEDFQQQLANKEEECLHLVRLTEQRRHELAALQAEVKGAEGRTGSALLAQGAQLSAASLALFRLTTRLDAMLSELSSHHLSPEEQDALIQRDRRSSANISNISEQLVDSAPSPAADSASDNADHEVNTAPEDNLLADVKRPDENDDKPKQFHPLVGSSSLQDLSDAINLSRRRPPEGREEPIPAVDEELKLASSFVDQLEEADQVLSKLLRLVERVLQEKDSRLQTLGDEKEQLLATLSAQANVLQEAKDELSKLRRADEHQYELGLKVQQLQAKLDQAYEEISRMEKADSPDGDVYFGKRGPTWNDDDAIPTQQWISVVSKVLDNLPEETLESNPSLESLRLQLQLISRNGQDPNANGTG